MILQPNITYTPDRVTWYGEGGIGGTPKCDMGGGYGPVDGRYFAALPLAGFDYSVCGQCIRVVYENRSVVLPVVDSCEACVGLQLDMSFASFSELVGGDDNARSIGILPNATYAVAVCGSHGAANGSLPLWLPPGAPSGPSINVGLAVGASFGVAVVLVGAGWLAYRYRWQLKRLIRNL